MNGWIAVAGTILGVLIGGGLTWLNSRFQLKQMEAKDRKKFLLAKLEELYEIISQIGQSYSELTSEQSKIVIDRLEFQVPNSPKLPMDKLDMLVSFYATELKITLSKLTRCCEDYGEVLVRRLGLESRSNEAIKAFIDDLKREDTKVSQACIAMKKHITKLTKNYI
jgi:hypothetical protein